MNNSALIVPVLDLYGSLKFLAQLFFDYRYWKYLIIEIRNARTPPPGPPTSPSTERAQPPSSPYPPRPSQAPLTSPPPRQRTRPSPIPSPREVPTPLRSQTPIYDTNGVGKIGKDSLGILLLTGSPTERDIKSQYRRLAIIYHPENMTRNQLV